MSTRNGVLCSNRAWRVGSPVCRRCKKATRLFWAHLKREAKAAVTKKTCQSQRELQGAQSLRFQINCELHCVAVAARHVARCELRARCLIGRLQVAMDLRGSMSGECRENVSSIASGAHFRVVLRSRETEKCTSRRVSLVATTNFAN